MFMSLFIKLHLTSFIAFSSMKWNLFSFVAFSEERCLRCNLKLVLILPVCEVQILQVTSYANVYNELLYQLTYFICYDTHQCSQWCAQVCHLQATITCRQQKGRPGRTGFSGGETGVRCLYFPCGGFWLLWSMCHTTISNSRNSNAKGGEWETESSYIGIRVRKRDRLAGAGGRKQWERWLCMCFVCLEWHSWEVESGWFLYLGSVDLALDL